MAYKSATKIYSHRYQPYNFKKIEFRKLFNLLNKTAKCLFGNCFSSYCFENIYTEIAIWDDVGKKWKLENL